MWWRAPWLEQRWTLLGLAMFDASLVIGTYNLLFWRQFDRWAGVTGSITAAATVWLICSYLLGRYSEVSWEKRKRIYRFWKTAIAAMVVLASVVVVGVWWLQVKDPRVYRSFVVPILGACCVGSALAQEIVWRTKGEVKSWEIFAREREIAALKAAIGSELVSPSVKLTFSDTAETLQHKSKQANQGMGIAIDEQIEASEEVIEKLLKLKGEGVQICDLVAWCERYLQRIPPELVSRRALVIAEGFELQPGRFKWRTKRIFDVFAGAILLGATLPIMAISAIIIKIEDGGPVLYSQKRTGLYGEEFRIWKLRTMRVGAERSGPEWSERGDKRITRVGYWLRLTRIDELPQLTCVIRGEMSLIGPRPERPEIEKLLEERIPHYRVRHWARPGLSGWAQVCYPYGASLEDSKNKLSYDLFYLRNASISLDLLILMKTIRLVFRAEGALALGKENKDTKKPKCL